jgi:hypothetical protein
MHARSIGIVLVCMTVGAAGGQPPSPPPRNPEFAALASVAVTLPPEFAVDVLLRLAGSPRIVPLDWKRDLVDEAWERSYFIRERFARGAPTAPADSRAAMLTRAYDSKFDRLSLQTRAVRMMMALSPIRAREMFEWIDFELGPPSCEDPLVAVVDDYYDTLAAVARASYGTSLMERADALSFFELYMWKASRPGEMLSIAKAVNSYKPTAGEALYLQTVMQWILEHGEREPRGFSTIGPDLVSKMGDVDARHRELGVVGATLMRALRRYLVAQFTGPRCADSLTERRTLDAFNRLIAGRADPALTAIGSSDSRPSRMLGIARLDRLWQTPESLRLRNVAARLFGDGRRPLSEAAKNARDWQENATEFLLDLERWNGAREPNELDYLYEKSVLLTGFIEIAPIGPLRTRAIRDAVAFLRRSAGREQPGSWYSHLSRLLDLAIGRDRQPILDALEGSEEPTLATYARIERMQLSKRLTE